MNAEAHSRIGESGNRGIGDISRRQLMPLETLYMELTRMRETISGGPALKLGEVKARILRAMHVKPSFTVRDLVTLCDCKGGYAWRLINELVHAGEVRKVGAVAVRGRRFGVYQVTDRDKFFLEHIHQ